MYRCAWLDASSTRMSYQPHLVGGAMLLGKTPFPHLSVVAATGVLLFALLLVLCFMSCARTCLLSRLLPCCWVFSILASLWLSSISYGWFLPRVRGYVARIVLLWSSVFSFYRLVFGSWPSTILAAQRLSMSKAMML